MAKEADFYSPEEAAKALGIPERRIFGMLCGGELEGQQDEWARWRIPASALRRAREAHGSPSDPTGSVEGDVGSPAAGHEASGEEVAATTVPSDRALLRKPPNGAEMPGDEEETQEAGEALLGDERRREHQERQPSHDARAGSSGTETTEQLPHIDHREMAAPDAAFNETVRELAERLAAAAAATGKLRAHLELAEVTESTLRENLERERQRADRESERAERERRTVERLEEELRAERNKGFWKKLFGG